MEKTRATQVEALRDQFQKHGVRKVKVGGFDVDGILRGKYLSLEKFWSAAEGGLGFCDVVFGWDISDQLYDNATVTGWHTGYPDVRATIDLSTYRIIPWEPGTAAFLLDFEAEPGKPLLVSPRQLLKRIDERARSMGFSVKVASEYEFFLFRETPESVRAKGYSNLTPLSPGMFGYSWLRASENAPLVHDLQDQLAAFDLELEGFHTETGPGVYEAALGFSEALAQADRAVLFKTGAKEIGARFGIMPSFMAKWNQHLPGCSGHIHQSLSDGKANQFYDAKSPRKMSKLFDGPATVKGTYAFQSNYVQRTYSVLDQLPFMNGGIYWTLREFAVEPAGAFPPYPLPVRTFGRAVSC